MARAERSPRSAPRTAGCPPPPHVQGILRLGQWSLASASGISALRGSWGSKGHAGLPAAQLGSATLEELSAQEGMVFLSPLSPGTAPLSWSFQDQPCGGAAGPQSR